MAGPEFGKARNFELSSLPGIARVSPMPPSVAWHRYEGIGANGQGDSQKKVHPFDLNPATAQLEELELRCIRHASSAPNAALEEIIAAADVEVYEIYRKAEQARIRWEAAEAELRTKADGATFLRLPSLERCLRLPTSLDHYSSKSPGPSEAGQMFGAPRSHPVEGAWEASNARGRGRSSSALSFLTPSLRHLEKAIPDELRARLAMYRSDPEQMVALEERVAFYDSQHPRGKGVLAELHGIVEKNKESVRNLSPDILLEERRRKLHEQMAQKQERLERARERRLLQLAEHEERLRQTVARSVKGDDGHAMAFALGRPMESEEQRRKRQTRERQEATSKAWLTLVALISRLSLLGERVQEHRVLEFKRHRMVRAARTIQTWYRAGLVMRRQERRNQSALLIQRNFRRWAFVHGIRARQRNAGAILSFLRQVSKANMVAAAFRAFRSKVVLIQRCLKDHCAVSAARQVLVCELWEKYERDLTLHAQVATKGKRKAARVHFEGGEAAGKGGSKDGKGGSVKEGPVAAAESKAGPEKQADAYVGVTIPRAVKMQVAVTYIEEERRRFGERMRAHQLALQAFRKRWAADSKLLAAKLMVQGVDAGSMAAEIERLRSLECPPAPKWQRLLTTQELAELHARGLKEAPEYYRAKRQDA
ncbi:hypothetical protein KFL_001790080 [Klebsormidium nitens]|uniref:Uncharacterized protein n=1 Tax=Klebsormidium nitens TaxID=105231 RepID=A0A1Y1HZQ9_KLENI|nr:hypothetical protein KFL_001790080 [Klebsormidium nitens]|eukprot:GAQ84170.1 hypothetical protein KFL_001790080 [Klebsormidium nitens]